MNRCFHFAARRAANGSGRCLAAGRTAAKITATLLLLGCLLNATRARGSEPGFSEYQVKALFLFNFAKYVDWPEEAFATSNSPIIISVLGQDNFKDNLTRVVEGKNINGRKIVIKLLITDPEYHGCHILFISGSEKSRLAEIFSATDSLPILTVGEHDQFISRGGIINFTRKDEKIRLQINLDAARKARVQVSAKLLSVADVVKGKSN